MGVVLLGSIEMDELVVDVNSLRRWLEVLVELRMLGSVVFSVA